MEKLSEETSLDSLDEEDGEDEELDPRIGVRNKQCLYQYFSRRNWHLRLRARNCKLLFAPGLKNNLEERPCR